MCLVCQSQDPLATLTHTLWGALKSEIKNGRTFGPHFPKNPKSTSMVHQRDSSRAEVPRYSQLELLPGLARTKYDAAASFAAIRASPCPKMGLGVAGARYIARHRNVIWPRSCCLRCSKTPNAVSPSIAITAARYREAHTRKTAILPKNEKLPLSGFEPVHAPKSQRRPWDSNLGGGTPPGPTSPTFPRHLFLCYRGAQLRI